MANCRILPHDLDSRLRGATLDPQQARHGARSVGDLIPAEALIQAMRPPARPGRSLRFVPGLMVKVLSPHGERHARLDWTSDGTAILVEERS